MGEGTRGEGADDYRVPFYGGDELDDMARNQHTDEDNHGSRSFHWLILHYTLERAGFPGLGPGPQPRKCRIAIVPDLLWQTGSMGNKILCGSRQSSDMDLSPGRVPVQMGGLKFTIQAGNAGHKLGAIGFGHFGVSGFRMSGYRK